MNDDYGAKALHEVRLLAGRLDAAAQSERRALQRAVRMESACRRAYDLLNLGPALVTWQKEMDSERQRVVALLEKALEV